MILQLVRLLAERVSRGVVLRRKLPARVGGARIYVSPDAALRFWLPGLATVDAGLLEAACELVRPGDVVWDVGSNVGLFTFAAAGLTGALGLVVAPEPDPFLLGLLSRSARRLPASYGRVEVVAAAASEKCGLAHLCIAARGRASNYLEGAGRSQAGGVREREWASALTLDSLLAVFPPPAVLKIDVEGHEEQVLAGGHRVLGTHRPTILCEVGEGQAEPVTRVFRDFGYELFDADVARETRRPLARAAWNTLAVPARRHADAGEAAKALNSL